MSNISPENGIKTTIIYDSDELKVDTDGCRGCSITGKVAETIIEEYEKDRHIVTSDNSNLFIFIRKDPEIERATIGAHILNTKGSGEVCSIAFHPDNSLTNCAKCKGKNPDTGPVLAVEEHYYFVLRRGS